MLMGMRSHEECASALALTWNLFVSPLGLSSRNELGFFDGLFAYPNDQAKAQMAR